MKAMCAFANGRNDAGFVHPVVRAIVLHFWLGFDHPFIDGNGRTARALFYWCMLRNGAWLTEFLSISNIIVQAPVKYARAFLYTETDDNDLTYFVLFNLRCIKLAIKELQDHLREKLQEVREMEKLLKGQADLNYRQHALLSHAVKHPLASYTIRSHQTSHNIAYATARSDLLGLVDRQFLSMARSGKSMIFTVAEDFDERIRQRI
jgi:Fic family protein